VSWCRRYARDAEAIEDPVRLRETPPVKVSAALADESVEDMKMRIVTIACTGGPVFLDGASHSSYRTFSHQASDTQIVTLASKDSLTSEASYATEESKVFNASDCYGYIFSKLYGFSRFSRSYT